VSIVLNQLPWVALSLAGILFVRRLRLGGHPAETWGIGILTGLAGGTLLLFLFALAGLRLHKGLVLGTVALLLAGAGFWEWFAQRREARRAGRAARRREAVPAAAAWTPAEGLLGLLILFLFFTAAFKANFFPVRAMDAHSYDGRARWIASEETLALSFYEIYAVNSTNNLTYPPLYPLTLALGHYAGGPGQGAVPYFFAGVLLAFHGILARRVTRTAALFLTLLLCATPDVWNHAGLALTNLPAMAFWGTGLLLAASESMKPDGSLRRIAMAGFLLLGAAGVRSDATPLLLLPALAIAALGFPGASPGRRALVLALLIAPPAVITLLWQWYLKSGLGVIDRSPFRPSLLPEPRLVRVYGLALLRHAGTAGVFGWVFWLAGALVLPSAVVVARRPRSEPARLYLLHVSVLLLGAAGLVMLFQQLRIEFGGGPAEIASTSYKRALFYLVPIAIASIGLSPIVRGATEALSRWELAGPVAAGESGARRTPRARES
jgi:hypothetical protein